MSAGRQHGFTLIEMLLVLVVLALVAAMTTARFGASNATENLQGTAQEIASRYRAARSGAVRGGNDQIVLIDLAERVMTGGDRAPLHIPPAFSILAETSATERPSPSVAAVRFLPNGSSTGGMVRLASVSEAYEIRINWFTGRVSVEATR
jgi:general secretion pathway protein H